MSDGPPVPEGLAAIRLDPYGTGAGFAVIVDADALLSSIDNQCRTGWQSRLSQLCDASMVPVFSSVHVYDEVYRGLHKFVSDTVTLDQLRSCFEEHYLPGIVWVEVAPGCGADPRTQYVDAIDPSDVPTAHLASLIAPCMVFADDKSLRRPGFAPELWRDAAGWSVDVVEGENGKRVVATVGILPVVGLVKGTVAVGRRVRLPPWVSVAVLLATTTWALWTPERRSATWKFLETPVEVLAMEFDRHEQTQREALGKLEPVIWRPALLTTSKQMIATVLARVARPLLAAEIRDEMQFSCDESSPPSLAEIRQLVASEPEFIQPERSRWQLGGSKPPDL